MDYTQTRTEGREIFSTDRKALQINLDKVFYGSFAEIGAGQDTAGVFFKAGGASQTVAKTMSAYDMKFSDSIYGAEDHGRYVSESRLYKMLDHEYQLLNERLNERAEDTCFFVFANTVATINFHKTKPGHGWIGCRFQIRPNMPPNDVIIHVRLKEQEKLLQHKTLGILGVNLIFACRYYHNDATTLMMSLMDNLTWDKVEIDMFRATGPDFSDVDNRLMSLRLVRYGLTDATMFLPDGKVVQASDLLYKKNVLLLRSRFKPITSLSIDMLTNAIRDFSAMLEPGAGEPLVISELSLNNLYLKDTDIDERDFLDRADTLCALGHTVMISNFMEHYILSQYFSRHYTREQICVVMGMPTIVDMFKEEMYSHLPGGILEGMSRLFNNQATVLVYPMIDADGNILDLNSYQCAENVKPLYDYLLRNGRMRNISHYNPALLGIYADKVLKMLQEGNAEWEKYVPSYVANIIKDKKIFGYKDPALSSSGY